MLQKATRPVRFRQVLGRASRLGPKKEAAILALVSSWSVEEAARVADIAHHTLLRWMKDRAFDAAYRAAQRAEYRQSMARLRQSAPAAAATLIRTVADSSARPGLRLHAALLVLRHAEDLNEMKDCMAEVAEMEYEAQARRPPIAGHGAKFPRRWKKAITALLKQRSIAEAARFAGIGTQTLYRWLEDPAFLAEYGEAARAAFAPAMMILLRGVSTAITLVQNFATDSSKPKGISAKAAQVVSELTKASEVKDLKARVAALEPVTPGARQREPERTWRIIGRELHQKVQQLKALLSPARWPDDLQMVYAHAVDGRPAGTSVVGKDGWHVWLKPPEGGREGEPVEKAEPAAPDVETA
jgi:transposase-like protein